MESLNEKIKRLRKQSGLSQIEVARSAGINQASYSNLEKGDTKSISIEVGKGIARTLGISFNELFGVEGNNPTEELLKKENESLREEVWELKNRLKEKDLLINSLTSQNRHVKGVLMAEVYLDHLRKLEKIDEQIKTSVDENKKQRLMEESANIRKLEKRKLKIYLNAGVLEQKDLDEEYKKLEENWKGHLDDMNRLGL